MGTRDSILAAVIQLLAKKHYASVSMTDIAEVCDVAKPTIYYHFKSKKGLYLELARSILEHVRAELAKITDSDINLRETLMRIVQIRFKSLRENPDLVSAHFSFLFDPDIRDLIDSLQDEIGALQQAIVPKFIQAIKAGEIKPEIDPILISIMFHSTLNACLVRVLHGCSTFDELPEPESIVDVIFEGIRAQN